MVSAIGHEIDITISDLVADLRAPTPSATAELLVLEKESLFDHLKEITIRLHSGIKAHLGNLNQRLILVSRGLRDPKKRIADSWMRLDELDNRLIRLMDLIVKESKKRLTSEGRALLYYSPINIVSSLQQKNDFERRSLIRIMMRRLHEDRMNLSLLEEKMKDLSPLSVLKRGYSITRKLPEETVVKDVSEVKKGDHVNIMLAKGELESRIEKIVKK